LTSIKKDKKQTYPDPLIFLPYSASFSLQNRLIFITFVRYFYTRQLAPSASAEVPSKLPLFSGKTVPDL